MNSRAMEDLLYRNHEERISSMRGRDLPKLRPDASEANEARELLRTSRREAVLALYAKGLSGKEIAVLLRLTPKQVAHAVKP